MGSNVFIIAEAGVNHNGNLENAKELAYQAKLAGADAVKFQTYKSENVVSKYAEKADYQKENTNSEESQLEMVKKLELSYDEFIELKKYCDKIGIQFMSTAFDLESINFLEKLGVTTWKVPSGELTNLPYLIKIAKLNTSVILSTGMSTMEEIETTVSILKEYGVKELIVLHCTTEYPTPYEDVNLKAMETIGNHLKVEIGYSDHTKGIEVPIAAVAMGAKVIEKHFTLDNNLEGPDHKASLEPQELKQMVTSIRNIQLAIGDGVKEPAKSEMKNISIARKSIVAKTNISVGDFFTESNLTVKRPGNGISPMKWFEIIGNKAPKNFKEDELIEL